MFSLWIGLIFSVANLVWIFLSLGETVSFWQFSSFMFVLGGIIASSIISFGIKHNINTVIYLLGMLFGWKKRYSDSYCNKMIEQFVNISKTTGKDRVAMVNALESLATKKKDAVFTYAVELISVGYDSKQLAAITQNRIDYFYFNELNISQVLKDMGASAPAFGMMGTVMGLIVVLSRIEDPSQLGQGLSVALITTLYGVLSSRAIFAPLSTMSKSITLKTHLYRHFIIEALQRLVDRTSPVELEDYLKSYFK